MRITRTIRNVLALAALSLTLPACTSTDLLYDAEGNPPSDEIVLSISMPEEVLQTRAGEIPHQGHTLRYTAKLFKADGTFVDMKQALATDDAALIRFKAINGQEYKAYIFADYIPYASAQNPNDNGTYQDCYYETTTQDEYFNMMAFSIKEGNKLKKYQYNCINNDNYDCFGANKVEIVKDPEGNYYPVKLKRIVSKVRIVNSELTSVKTISSIEVNKFAYKTSYSSLFSWGKIDTDFNKLGIDKYDLAETTSTDNTELFYFYTFATVDEDEKLGEIKFTLTFTDGNKQETTIPASTIKVRQNYVTTVRGNFMPPAGPDADFITFDLSVDKGWNSPDKETTVTNQ